MEYVWPARRNRDSISSSDREVDSAASSATIIQRAASNDASRSSLDSHPVVKYGNRISSDEQRRPTLGFPSRRLTSSRSFNDLRSTSRLQSGYLASPGPEKSDLFFNKNESRPANIRRNSSNLLDVTSKQKSKDDAIEMKSRSAQKTFVLVQVSRSVIPSLVP